LVRTSAATVYLGSVLAQSVAGAAPPSLTEAGGLARSRAAAELAVPPDDVVAIREADVELTLADRQYLMSTWLDPASGHQVQIAVDTLGGATFDADEMAALVARHSRKGEKFSPDARDLLAKGDESTLLAFVLARPDYADAVKRYQDAHTGVAWDGESPAVTDPAAGEALRLGLLRAKATVLAEARAGFVAEAQQLGAKVVYAFEIVSMVYLEADRTTAETLAARADVGEVLAPGSFSLAMDVAKPAVGADITESLGLDGSFIKLGIVEYARINWAHSGLSAVPHSSMFVNTGNTGCSSGQMGGTPDTIPHMSWVTAIAASRSTTLPGIANDVTIVEASAASDDDLPNSDLRILTAAECAVLAGATVINLSLAQNDPGNFATSDRFFDELVDESHVTVVAASGDNGPAPEAPTNPDHCRDANHTVPSPARGWNVVGVGAYNDGNVRGSGDDELWWRSDNTGPAYCWGDPPAMPWDGTSTDREKPELSAPGVLLQTSTGHQFSGTSGSSPVVAATVATMMENDLTLWTEPERVRAALVAGSRVDRTPKPNGQFNQDMEGWGSLSARWSNLIADQGSNGKNGRKTFNGVETGVPSCAYTKPGFQTQTFTGAANRFIRFVVTWNSHNLSGVDSRATDYNVSIKKPGRYRYRHE
jgi:hypothetical protein